MAKMIYGPCGRCDQCDEPENARPLIPVPGTDLYVCPECFNEMTGTTFEDELEEQYELF